MRAWFVVGSLQILAVCAMISTSAFGLFDIKASVFSTLCSDGEELHACVPFILIVRPRYFKHFVLMVKNCMPVYLGGFLQPIFFQWVLDLVVINEWLLWSSKPCSARMFIGVPFLYRRLFNVIFKLRQAMDE